MAVHPILFSSCAGTVCVVSAISTTGMMNEDCGEDETLQTSELASTPLKKA